MHSSGARKPGLGSRRADLRIGHRGAASVRRRPGTIAAAQGSRAHAPANRTDDLAARDLEFGRGAGALDVSGSRRPGRIAIAGARLQRDGRRPGALHRRAAPCRNLAQVRDTRCSGRAEGPLRCVAGEPLGGRGVPAHANRDPTGQDRKPDRTQPVIGRLAARSARLAVATGAAGPGQHDPVRAAGRLVSLGALGAAGRRANVLPPG
jgi:hypothetical protein